MEITKDIKIDTSNLIKNSEIEIQYSGKLKNSKEVFINFGYQPNSFEYTKLKLTENNTVKIKLNQPGFFYFFFTDNVGKIDNNYYKDYQLYIKTSNLILTENSSMKELPYRYFLNNQDIYKTFYTSQLIKNTSRPQEIILPRPFNSKNSTKETKTINGYIVEPVKPVVNYNLTEALIPTEHVTTVSIIKSNKKRSFISIFNSSINKIIVTIPKLFGTDYSKQKQ